MRRVKRGETRTKEKKEKERPFTQEEMTTNEEKVERTDEQGIEKGVEIRKRWKEED